jgi:outer membrane biosynthesis protein TonB
MTNRHTPIIAALAFLSISTLAHAQAPSKAQQDALRSNCRSDFMRNCSSVTPGGREALECLMQNKAKVSAGCQGALNTIAAPAPTAAKPEPKPEPKAEPKAETKPEPKAAATPKAEPAPAAAAPASPAASAPAHHATTPPATNQPAAPKATKTAPAPKAAAAPARTAPSAAAPAAAPPPPVTHQPRLGEAMLIRRFCTMDFKVLCQGVQLGQGRAIQCLANNAGALSPGCRQAMAQTGELQP